MNEKIEEKTVDNVTPIGGAPLALIQNAAPRVRKADPMNWTQADIDLVAKNICPSGIPEGELRMFIARCQASGMNPLLSEAFCVPRNVNIGSKNAPQWIKQYVFQAAEAGMEARADDFPEFRGLRASAVYSKDKIVIDSSAGEVSHQYNPAEDRGRLLGAYAIVYREGRKTPIEYVLLAEYADGTNPQWSQRPATMITKCARAAALRRSFPNHFGGVYEAAELGDPTAAAPTDAQVEQANRPTTDTLAERLKSTAQKQADIAPPKASNATITVVKTEPKPVEQPPSSAQSAAPVEDPKLPHQVADEKKAATAAAGPVVIFGAKKGTPIKDLSGVEIVEAISLGTQKLSGLSPAQQAKVQACIADLSAEEKRRTDDLLADVNPPEPGSAG